MSHTEAALQSSVQQPSQDALIVISLANKMSQIFGENGRDERGTNAR